MADNHPLRPCCRRLLMRVTVASDRDDIEEVEALVKSVASAAGADYRTSEDCGEVRDHYVSGTESQLRKFVEQLGRTGARGLLLGENWYSR